MIDKIWKNADRIAISLVIVMMAMQVSLFKIFAGFIPIFNYAYNTPLLCAIYVVMMAAIYVLVFVPRIMVCNMPLTIDERTTGKLATFLKRVGLTVREVWNEYYYLVLELIILLFAIIITDVVTIVNGQLRITNILTHNLDYFYVFLALPITILVVENKWKFCDFVEAILVLSIASMILRIFVVSYAKNTGIVIDCIALESAFEGWERNGRIRVSPPCFLMLCAPLAMYMLFTTKMFAKKVWYGFVIIMTFIYVYGIWQSRVAIVFVLGGIGTMIMFGATSRIFNIARWSVVAAGCVGFVMVGGLQKIATMFSIDPNVATLSGENRGHYYAYSIFGAHFRQNLLFGAGLTENLTIQNYGEDRYQWLIDAGVLYSLEPMGILMAIFFILMFGRGIYVYLSNRKFSYIAILPLALTAVLLLSEVSMDAFATVRAFAVPFYIVIVEYCARCDEPDCDSVLIDAIKIEEN